MLPMTAIWSQKTYTATRLERTPVLDGLADDRCWQQIAPTDMALTSIPVFGLPALPSTVRLFYTADALYVAATFSGSAPRRDRSQRDNTGFADWFSIGLDTWDDDQNAFVFTVTAAGIQAETSVGSNTADSNWDAVWQSVVAQQADGWSVEIRLPFTALRFPVQHEQHWGLQFSRFNNGTLSTWNPRQPLIGDEILQYGALEGLQGIRQDRRLSAEVLGSVDQAYTDKDSVGQGFGRATLGIDGRIGFGSNATLDVALLPGTTASWLDHVLHPLEKKISVDWLNNDPLPAPRQLLAEGSSIFSKNEIWLDYPRAGTRQVPLAPGEYFGKYNYSKVWTTAKFTTRLPGKVNVGVYSALMGPANAVIITYPDLGPSVEQTRPVSGVNNYTVLTIEKALANNSWISLANAGLWGHQPFSNNLSALNFQLRERSNRYQIAGNVQANAPEVNDSTYRSRVQYQFSAAKVNGAWTWRLAHEHSAAISSDILNADPLFPYLQYAYSYSSAELHYRDFTSHAGRQNTTVSLRLNKRWPEQTAAFTPLNLQASISTLTQRFQRWAVTFSSDLEKGVRTYVFNNDLALSRYVSPYLQTTLSFRSDTRKRFNYQLIMRAGSNLVREEAGLETNALLYWAMSSKFRLSSENTWSFSARATAPLFFTLTPGYYLLEYDQLRINNGWTLNWYCTRSFNVYAQVNWQLVKNQKERALEVTPDGRSIPSDVPITHFPRHFDREAGIGGQWFFAPISQLRFQFYQDLNRTGFLDNNGLTSYPSAAAQTTLASLAFIYWLQ